MLAHFRESEPNLLSAVAGASTDMKLAIGIDVHKEKCAAHATNGGINELKPKQKAFLEKFNRDFRRFPSDVRGFTDLAQRVKDHEAHILIENSTKSHDVYWILKGLGLDVIVAHATDLKRITESDRKNDDNDAYELAHYMRRRLMGENEFHESHIPGRETLIRREMCRFTLDDRSQLTATKLQMRSHLLIRGIELPTKHKNIASAKALKEIRELKDPILMLDAKKADDLVIRITYTEKLLYYEFASDEVFSIVYSIPGFGILSAAYVSCMGDDFSRFRDGRGYAASIGLIPKQHESADSGSNCAITRRGDPDLRRLYAQATFVHIFHAESHISEKYRRLKKNGKSHNEALVACANSMARMVFKLITTHSEYVSDPKLLAEARGIADSEDIEDEMEDASKKD